MITPIGLNGNFTSVPHIPADIKLKDIAILFPEGFEDILEYEIDEFSKSVSIQILNDSNRNNTIITLDSSFFNPSSVKCLFPKFLIEQSHRYSRIDYLTDTRNRFIFNQNELFYITLQHRLCAFREFKDAYGNLVATDIKALKSFIQNIPNTAYNAIQKDLNSYIVMSIFDEKTGLLKRVNKYQCLGNILKAKAYIPNKEKLANLIQTLPLHFSSESMGEKSKYVLHSYKSPLYRSVGYDVVVDNKGNAIAKSLFPPKQNIPARNKTHVTANAYALANFEPTSHFIQDYLPNMETQSYEPKDHCYRKALCVIHPMLDNGKFLYGEVYASENFVKTEVIVRETVVEQIEEMYIELNQTLKADHKERIKICRTIENEDIYLENCLAATLDQIQIVGTLGVQKLVFNVVRHAGNARIDSNTGLKGVTTCRNNMGTIHIDELNLELKPDLVFGMNSFKAKGNGIILARAALAVELGLYKPKHRTGLLNTLDQDEINRASNSLPKYYFIDNMGNQQEVQIGIVYARYTELCYIFKSYGNNKPFSFESGRVLHSLKDNRLFQNIWDNYVVEDYKEIIIEFEKILLDNNDIFNDDLPIYTADQIKNKGIFEIKDLILNIRTAAESMSKLLDENWNKGFILNLTRNGGKYIRIPCAKTLNMFCTQTDDKMYMYPGLLIEISKIISNILTNNLQLLFPKTDTVYSRTNTPVIRYFKEIKGLLFSSEEAAVMLIQKLSRPELPGFAFKQVTDWILPENTCVIMCNKTYNKALYGALGEEGPAYELMHGFYGMHVRAPSLWRSQNLPVRIWNQDDFRMYLHCKHGIKLEDYINTEWNNDVVIFSNDVCKKSQSDIDGDHSTVYIPAGEEVQELLKNFEDEHITEAEHQWIQTYIDGEKESNDDLIKDGKLVAHTYTLYDVPLHDIRLNSKKILPGFSTFLYRAITAKANIGLATNDGWIFNMLLDIYQSYYKQNNGKYKVTEDGQEKPMHPLSEAQRDEVSFSYTRALQDFVVRGVKHTNNGSEDFEILFLKNFWKAENSKDVFKLLTQDLKLHPTLASKMIFVVTWAETLGLLQACGAFLKLYNKGTIPKDEVAEALNKHEAYIQENTYFGMLLKDVYDLRKHASEYKVTSVEKARAQPFVDPLAAFGF